MTSGRQVQAKKRLHYRDIDVSRPVEESGQHGVPEEPQECRNDKSGSRRVAQEDQLQPKVEGEEPPEKRLVSAAGLHCLAAPAGCSAKVHTSDLVDRRRFSADSGGEIDGPPTEV